MTTGKRLRPEKAVLAAHEWIRALILHGLNKHFPTPRQRETYSEAALEQIRGVITESVEAYQPSVGRRAEWD